MESPKSPTSRFPKSPVNLPRNSKAELCLKRTRSLRDKQDGPVELIGTIPQRQLSHPGWVRCGFCYDTKYCEAVLKVSFIAQGYGLLLDRANFRFSLLHDHVRHGSVDGGLF